MSGPECVVVECVQVRAGRRGQGPSVWLVVCRCGWSRRVVGSEERALQSHSAHKHDGPDLTDPGPITQALVAMGKVGLSYETVEETREADQTAVGEEA